MCCNSAVVCVSVLKVERSNVIRAHLKYTQQHLWLRHGKWNRVKRANIQLCLGDYYPVSFERVSLGCDKYTPEGLRPLSHPE